jgi:hypothetical protein
MTFEEVKELNGALLEISKQEPNITSIKILKDLYDAKQLKAEKKLEKEKAAKEKEKEATAFVPSSKKHTDDSASKIRDIKKAQTMEELLAIGESL